MRQAFRDLCNLQQQSGFRRTVGMEVCCIALWRQTRSKQSISNFFWSFSANAKPIDERIFGVSTDERIFTTGCWYWKDFHNWSLVQDFKSKTFFGLGEKISLFGIAESNISEGTYVEKRCTAYDLNVERNKTMLIRRCAPRVQPNFETDPFHLHSILVDSLVL